MTSVSFASPQTHLPLHSLHFSPPVDVPSGVSGPVFSCSSSSGCTVSPDASCSTCSYPSSISIPIPSTTLSTGNSCSAFSSSASHPLAAPALALLPAASHPPAAPAPALLPAASHSLAAPVLSLLPAPPMDLQSYEFIVPLLIFSLSSENLLPDSHSFRPRIRIPSSACPDFMSFQNTL